jgi:tRNA modification GTPase
MGDSDQPVSPGAIVVHGRCDLPDRSHVPHHADLAVSAQTGAGLAELQALLVSRGTSLLPREGEIALGQRQREALADCLIALTDARGTDILLLSESLRAARASLDRLTGEGGVEPLLDAIFSRFCIGK